MPIPVGVQEHYRDQNSANLPSRAATYNGLMDQPHAPMSNGYGPSQSALYRNGSNRASNGGGYSGYGDPRDDIRHSRDDGRHSRDDGRHSRDDGRHSRDDGRHSLDDIRFPRDDNRHSVRADIHRSSLELPQQQQRPLHREASGGSRPKYREPNNNSSLDFIGNGPLQREGSGHRVVNPLYHDHGRDEDAPGSSSREVQGQVYRNPVAIRMDSMERRSSRERGDGPPTPPAIRVDQETTHQMDVYIQQKRFPIEHLCTFTMDRKEGLVTIEDVIRKVQRLDAKGLIWSQYVLLQIADRDIKINEAATRSELESFSMNDISLVSAELNQCNYNSILVVQFKFSGEKTPQAYVFQCDQVPAEVVAKELQKNIDYVQGRRKRTRPEGRASSQSYSIPPPPEEPAPQPPLSEGNVRNKVAAFAAAAAMAQASGSGMNRGFQYPKSNPVRNSESDEPMEMLALRTERDVDLLNHCFDEIEAFISLLQKAAEAYTELVRRRKTRKSKKREPGDGLLLARSRPPSEGDYIECLKKFKLCFNLLAKLKNHIHDPNTPELIHFLMVPLELTIKSCQGLELASSIVSPLLTYQAVELLENCLTSRESDFWKSLGRAWNIPSTEWPKERPVPQYTPYFHDGWAPPPLPEHQASLDMSAAVAASAAAVARDRVPSGSDTSDGGYHGNKRNSSSSSIQSDQMKPSTPRTLEPPPPLVLTKPGVKGFVKPLFDFVARNVKELTIMSGEQLELLEDNRKWWKVRNSSGQYGYVPSTILTVIPHVNQQQRNPNFNSNHHAPSPQSPPTPPLLGASTSFDQSYSGNSMQQARGFQAPPPPPPPPGISAPMQPIARVENTNLDFATQLKNTIRKKDQQRKGINGKTHTDLHEELVKRMNQGRPRNFQVPHTSSGGGPHAIINYLSSAEDVTKWLQTKGFSKLTADSLGVLTGAQLFSLTKEELRQVCFDDANRVYSQLMVQKATLEDSTNTSSELQAIMDRRKVRSDGNGQEDDHDKSFNSPPPDFSPIAPPGFARD